MLPRLLAAALCLLPLPAFADGPWLFEFELSAMLPGYEDRLLSPTCTKVVPVQYAPFYAIEPRAGWEISCGNEQPMYYHFLGRRIAKPLPNLSFYLGWTHLSSPSDAHEISFDALSVRGRFEFGGACRKSRC